MIRGGFRPRGGGGGGGGAARPNPEPPSTRPPAPSGANQGGRVGGNPSLPGIGGDIEAIRALEAARRRERERQRAALEAQRAGERDLGSGGRGGSGGGTDGTSGTSSSGASSDTTPYEDYRQSERETFDASLNREIITPPELEPEDVWTSWLITEKWGTEPSTEQAISLFLGFVVAQDMAEASDGLALSALAALFRETMSDHENTALEVLLASGALNGVGITENTTEYLTGDFNIQLSDDPESQVQAVQELLAEEVLRFTEEGLLSDEARDFAEDALLDPTNMGILMALFYEGLENLSPDERNAYALYGQGYNYWANTVAPFYFRSQNENLYPEDTRPHGEMLLFAMSFFPVTDQIAAGIDLIRSLSEGDLLGAGLAATDFLPGPNVGGADNLMGVIRRNADDGDDLLGATDDLLDATTRNADEISTVDNVAGTREFSDIESGRRTSSITISGDSTIDVVIHSEHAFDRPHTIPGTGGQTSAFSRTQLTLDQVENAILDDVSQQIANGLVLPVPNSMNVRPSSYNGMLVVEGLEIGYHAIQTQDGKIRISTYFLTQPN
jgi:hypothetical protein